MRHRDKTPILKREPDQRRALIRNLATSLILHEGIETTKAKALAFQPFVERIITLAKNPTLSNRRQIEIMTDTKGAARKAVEIYGVRFKDTKGGYTKVLKTRHRKGDNALMIYISFVKPKSEKGEKTEKRGSSNSKFRTQNS